MRINDKIRRQQSKKRNKNRQLRPRLKCANSFVSISTAVTMFVLFRNDRLFANTSTSTHSVHTNEHTTLHTSTSVVVRAAAPHGQIPQHRVRAAKRDIEYRNDHPWIKSSNNHRRRNNANKSPPNGTSRMTDEVLGGSGDSNGGDGDSTIGESWWIQSDVDYFDTTVETETDTNIGTDTYQPIRIRAVLVPHSSSGYNFLTPEQRSYVLKIVKPALNTWSRALSVPRIEGNLTIDKDQLYDGMSCGPGIDSGMPSVVVPEDHFVVGESGVDLMVYISVGFREDFDLKLVEKNNQNKDDTESSSTTLPPSTSSPPTDTLNKVYDWAEFTNYTGPSVFFKPEEEPHVDGKNDDTTTTDHPTVPPTASPTVPPKYCSGTYLASATYCSTDQFDRPVGGLLHLCIGQDFFETQPNEADINHLTIMHELGHILGFNSHSLAHFRHRENGSALTERVDDDVPDVEVECTGVALGRGFATIPLPSKNILQFQDVRGVRVAQIVTPTVQQVVRNYFNCQNLHGAELESETYHPVNETSSNCIGDHWERRLFKYDIMNPIIDSLIPSTLISPLTLAYFIDSGWYEVNANRAYAANTWGRGGGCEFVNSPCLSSNGKVSNTNSKFFCSRHLGGKYDGCTDDFSSKAVCDITSYDSPLPTEYQYMPQGDNIGGIDADLDYCPIFVGTTDGSCRNKPGDITSNLHLDSFGSPASKCLSGKVGGKDVPLCIQIACDAESRELQVKVDGFWKKCDYTGQIIKDWFNTDYVECPDASLVCPTFNCPRDCLQNDYAAACNFTSGTCLCSDTESTAKIGPILYEKNDDDTTCNTDFSVDLSEHYILKEYYISDSSKLKDDNKNILDHAARFLITMSVGEVVSFVACSLLVVVSFTIISIYSVKLLRQRQIIFSLIPRWLSRSKDWRVDMTLTTFSRNQETENSGRRNKDKVVASILHDMRVQNATDGIERGFHQDAESVEGGFQAETQNNNVSVINSSVANEENQNRQHTILRSDLPPLPGVGRILSIPGFQYIDDSVQISNEDGLLTGTEGTAIGSRTSCHSSLLESCSIQSVRQSHFDGDIELSELYSMRRRK